MKFLFCALGSIGQRHLKNLLELGETDILALRHENRPLRTISQPIEAVMSLDEALKRKPDAAFITNPSMYHIPLALELAKRGVDLFIEKPLSTTTEGVKELLEIQKSKKLVIQMGFMLRYHPAFVKIRSLLNKKAIGFPVSARFSWGEYLPGWHPWEDYRKGYAGRRELGGGPIFTLCHDIDIATWLFGPAHEVFAWQSRQSSLHISTEHSVEILLKHQKQILSEIHIDYLATPPKRTVEIIGDTGRIEFDYYAGALRLYRRKGEGVAYQETSWDYSPTVDRNDLFKEELRLFLKRLRDRKPPEVPLMTGVDVLRVTIAAHRSIEEYRVLRLEEIDL